MNKNYENYKEWTTTDVNIAQGLLQSAFAFKYDSEEGYFDVIYLANITEHGAEWDRTTFDFERTVEELRDGTSWMKLDEMLRPSDCGNKDRYLEEVNVLQLLSLMVDYWGTHEIFGDYTPYPLSTADIADELHLDQEDVEFIDFIYESTWRESA